MDVGISIGFLLVIDSVIDSSAIFDQLLQSICTEPKLNAPYVRPYYVLTKDHKNGNLKGSPIIAAHDGPSAKLAKLYPSIFRILFVM